MNYLFATQCQLEHPAPLKPFVILCKFPHFLLPVSAPLLLSDSYISTAPLSPEEAPAAAIILFFVSSNFPIPLTPAFQQILLWFGILRNGPLIQGVKCNYFIWGVIPGEEGGEWPCDPLIVQTTTGFPALPSTPPIHCFHYYQNNLSKMFNHLLLKVWI